MNAMQITDTAAAVGRTTARVAVAALVTLIAAALPVMAETGSAESPDFTVNTVPEPAAAAALLVIGYSLFVARRKGTKESLKRHLWSVGLALLGCLAVAQTGMAAQPVVTNVVAQQQEWPSFLVDIYYDVDDADGQTQSVSAVISTNAGAVYDIVPTNFAGDIGFPVVIGTNKHIIWDAGETLPEFTSDTVRVRITADDIPGINPTVSTSEYLVVDVSAGPGATAYPVTELSAPPILDDQYRTTKILLRRIPAGSFVMGSPESELGRSVDEEQHTVTLSSNFYIAVFSTTQAQYSNVMGSNPSLDINPLHPVERASWNMIRNGTWPGGTPAAGTFMGNLRTKTGLAFDLPTEAQREYACRAGTTNALHNDTNLTNTLSDGNVEILACYYYNGGSNGHVTVGSYQANNWGLYDMHGSIWNWCLDWYGTYGGAVTNPPGLSTGTLRVRRGGTWNSNAAACRSAYRSSRAPAYEGNHTGFRAVCLSAGQE